MTLPEKIEKLREHLGPDVEVLVFNDPVDFSYRAKVVLRVESQLRLTDDFGGDFWDEAAKDIATNFNRKVLRAVGVSV